jgi:hypothetical protein
LSLNSSKENDKKMILGHKRELKKNLNTIFSDLFCLLKYNLRYIFLIHFIIF